MNRAWETEYLVDWYEGRPGSKAGYSMRNEELFNEELCKEVASIGT